MGVQHAAARPQRPPIHLGAAISPTQAEDSIAEAAAQTGKKSRPLQEKTTTGPKTDRSIDDFSLLVRTRVAGFFGGGQAQGYLVRPNLFHLSRFLLISRGLLFAGWRPG